MIKKLSIAVLTLLFFTFINKVEGQNRNLSPTYGIRGGILLSGIKGDDIYDDFARRLMLGGGVFGNIYMTPRISLQAELDFIPKGAKWKSDDATTKLNYLEVPVLLKGAFSKDPELYFYGGAYVAYLLTASTTGEVLDPLNQINTVDTNIKPNLNSFDMGLVAGFGVQGQFNKKTDIFLDLRYTYGLLNIAKDDGDYRYNVDELTRYSYDYDKPNNTTFFLTTGFYIYLHAR